jgi:hypothetical protein
MIHSVNCARSLARSNALARGCRSTSENAGEASKSIASYVRVLEDDGFRVGKAACLEHGLHHLVLVTPELVVRLSRTLRDLNLAGERIAVLNFIETIDLPVVTPVVRFARLDRPLG